MKKDPARNVYLISKIIDSGKAGFLLFKEAGITPIDLDEECKKFLEFIIEHHSKYNEIPSKQIFEQAFEFELPESHGTIDYWLDEVIHKKLLEEGVEACNRFREKAQDDYHSGILELRNFVRYSEGFSNKSSIIMASDQVNRQAQMLIEAKAKEIAIPTPWKKMDEWTSGWRPSNVIFVGARTGVGKTFFTILCAQAAVNKGVKVLYASGEMTPEMIFSRYSAIDSQISYSDLRSGDIAKKDEENYIKYLTGKFRENKLFHVIDFSKKKDGFSMDAIESAIQKVEPGLLIVDAAYMLKINETKFVRNQSDNMGQIAGALKKLSGQCNIAIMAAVQLNRAAIQKATYDDSDFALSDQISWYSDHMFTLKQNTEQFQQRLMEVANVKNREGKNDRVPFMTNWCLERMNFLQVGAKTIAPVTDISDYARKVKPHFQDGPDFDPPPPPTPAPPDLSQW